jgi:hypothetical protein
MWLVFNPTVPFFEYELIFLLSQNASSFSICHVGFPYFQVCTTSLVHSTSFTALISNISYSNMPPTLTCGSSRATQVVCASCTYFSNSWNFFVSASTCFLACKLFSIMDSTTYIVMCSSNTFMLSECACSILPFSISNYFIIFSTFSYRVSN